MTLPTQRRSELAAQQKVEIAFRRLIDLEHPIVVYRNRGPQAVVGLAKTSKIRTTGVERKRAVEDRWQKGCLKPKSGILVPDKTVDSFPRPWRCFW